MRYDLFHNIINNYVFVKNDFIGFNFDIAAIEHFLIRIIVSLLIMGAFYLLGNKLSNAFFPGYKNYTFFINILLGYIIVGTGIGLLGFFSLLQPHIIISFLLITVVIALYPFSVAKFKSKSLQLFKEQKKRKINFRRNFIIIGVALFVAISFLRLMTPEIGEDGYHTDLPGLYLNWGTTMHESREVLHVLAYPQLPEMIYFIPIFLGDKETARFIHFYFYVLLVLFLFTVAREKKYSFTKFTPLLFVTAPGAIRYSSTQYTDFFAILPFVVSVLLIKRNMSFRDGILAGIFFGAVVSAKVWMVVYLPLFLIYIVVTNKNLPFKKVLKLIMTFLLSYLLVALLWYIRAIIMMGSPIYPILNRIQTVEIYKLPVFPVSHYLGLNWEMFTFPNMVILSPLFFLALIFLVIKYQTIHKEIKKSPLLLFFILFTLEQLVIEVAWGRYLLAWFIFAAFIASSGLIAMISIGKNAKVLLYSMYAILFSYYFINTVLTLPYGFGWADQGKYLTRTLYRQSGDYYDFDQLFQRNISSNDLVAVYGVGSFYYAHFSYLDVGYIFDANHREFDLLKKAHVTKLLIHGGNIEWFCNTLSIKGCDTKRLKPLASYPAVVPTYTLYSIK